MSLKLISCCLPAGREREFSASIVMEADSGQLRLRVLSPQVRLTEEEILVSATTTVSDLKNIILARLQGQPAVKVG